MVEEWSVLGPVPLTTSVRVPLPLGGGGGGRPAGRRPAPGVTYHFPARFPGE